MRKKKIHISEIICIVILIFLAVLILYPLFWILMSSFKDYNGIFRDVWGLPHVLHFENYVKAWNKGISQYLLNSLIVTVSSIVGVVFVSTFAAFGICQLPKKIGGAIFLYCMAGLMLAPQVCVLPLFLLLRAMHINDTYLALIFPYIAFRLPLSIIMVRSYFQSIPKELQEAAIIDGATIMQVYNKIYLPLSKPIISTVVIIGSYNIWNEFTFATIFIDSAKLRTIPIGLMIFRNGLLTDWGAVLAGMVISCLPIIILFLLMQKNFIRGMTAGGVKG